MTIKEITDALNIYLARLGAMEPLEPSDKALSDEEHDVWMQRHEQIQQVVALACGEAERALPAEVLCLLRKVRSASVALYSPLEQEDQTPEH